MKAFHVVILSLILAGCGAKAPTKAPIVKEYYPGMVSQNPVIQPVEGIQVITVGGGKGAGSVDGIAADARFNAPQGVLAANGKLYVADTGNYLIREVSSDAVTTLAGSTLGYLDGQGKQAQFMGPSDLARDPQGNLLVADFNRIRKVSPDGTVTTLALKDSSGNPVKYVEIFGILCDSQGQLFISTLHRIDRVSPQGVVTTLAGGGDPGYRDGQGSLASFNLPRKMAFLGDRIAVADFGNLRIREVTMTGMVTTKTLAGTGDLGYVDGSAGTALMNFPIGVAADPSQNLYVADTYNQAVRLVTPDGRIQTLAGNNTYGYQDGNGILANFAQPSDLELDGPLIYVADTGNNAIRLIRRN